MKQSTSVLLGKNLDDKPTTMQLKSNVCERSEWEKMILIMFQKIHIWFYVQNRRTPPKGHVQNRRTTPKFHVQNRRTPP